ncbi:MAG: large subunit ribosomal protein L3 [Microgenomates group bacterium Gr01-1014_5]|nr:MAG: large subunit ribosomal protein L3 [Microgenomates group bacterium Gr01-1014_5]
MEQSFTQTGHRVPVTVVKTVGNVVTQVKTLEKDGYTALQLGIGTKKAKHTSKQLQGHFAPSLKASEAQAKNQKTEEQKNTYPRYLREVKTEEAYEVGTQINPAEVFQPGDLVKVTGISKGKGFAGGVKRWGFHGGPKTHGQSDRHRAPGSIGQGTTPGRVYKGKHMAGRMGGEVETVRNLTVLKSEADGVLWLSGPVPGNRDGLLIIEKLGQARHFTPLLSRDTTEEELVKAMETEAEEEAVNKAVVEGDPEAESSDSVIPVSQEKEEESK